MKTFYKIENNQLQVGQGTFIPEGFIEYTVGQEPEELKEALALEAIEQARTDINDTINTSCQKAIINGFVSSALGTEHSYESEEIDQLNLIGAVSSGVSQPLKCSEDGGETWGHKTHTNTQLKTVLKDGTKIKADYLQKAFVLKEQIKNATSLEELEQINW